MKRGSYERAFERLRKENMGRNRQGRRRNYKKWWKRILRRCLRSRVKEMDRKIYAMIPGHEDADSEDSAMESLSEEDQEALRLGRELQKRRKEKEEEKSRAKKRHHWKRITAAAAVLVLVIGIGTTGVGGPKRIVEMVEGTFGGRDASRVNVSKEETKDTEENKEERIYQEIKDKLDFDPVKIIILPNMMEYEYGEIDEDMQIAQLIYKYGDTNISYRMSVFLL